MQGVIPTHRASFLSSKDHDRTNHFFLGVFTNLPSIAYFRCGLPAGGPWLFFGSPTKEIHLLNKACPIISFSHLSSTILKLVSARKTRLRSTQGSLYDKRHLVGICCLQQDSRHITVKMCCEVFKPFAVEVKGCSGQGFSTGLTSYAPGPGVSKSAGPMNCQETDVHQAVGLKYIEIYMRIMRGVCSNTCSISLSWLSVFVSTNLQMTQTQFDATSAKQESQDQALHRDSTMCWTLSGWIHVNANVASRECFAALKVNRTGQPCPPPCLTSNTLDFLPTNQTCFDDAGAAAYCLFFINKGGDWDLALSGLRQKRAEGITVFDLSLKTFVLPAANSPLLRFLATISKKVQNIAKPYPKHFEILSDVEKFAGHSCWWKVIQHHPMCLGTNLQLATETPYGIEPNAHPTPLRSALDMNATLSLLFIRLIQGLETPSL